MKREDDKHTIAKIYGLCFSSSSGNKLINYMRNAVLIDISFRNYKIYFQKYSLIKWEKGVRSSLYKPIIKLSLGKH